ncbi:MAG: hypothetical protein MK312_03965 [Roseibacillus sp.]|nr:hypothetical protein [Roseibacillus sp.]
MTDRQKSPRILYCHCQYAQVIPSETKTAVLEGLWQSSKAFDAVADRCDMAARQDPALQSLSHEGPVKIAACFPRAIKWLFAGAKAPLDRDNTELLNMRETSAEMVLQRLEKEDMQPNLPEDNRPPQASESVPEKNPEKS